MQDAEAKGKWVHDLGEGYLLKALQLHLPSNQYYAYVIGTNDELSALMDEWQTTHFGSPLTLNK